MSVKINLCTSGDPTDPKTWSGTPHNIYQQLKKKDAIGIAFNFKSSGLLQKIAKALSILYYHSNADNDRGALLRYLNSKLAISKTASSVTLHTLHMGSYGVGLNKLPKNQYHYLYTDATWNLWSKQSAYMGKYSKKLMNDAELLDKNSYEQYRHIFTISEYVKANIADHYQIDPDKITVVGTGVGVIKPYFGEKKFNNGKILFVAKGRFEDKGGDLVIDAFKKALETNPDLELSIVGQRSYTDKTHHPKIKTYGFLPLEDLQEMFETHSLFLMPAYNEPWGLVYLEALSCKMPIVGLNRNAFPEISNYGECGFGLDDPDAELLAKTITDAFNNTEKLSQMAEAGQKYCLSKFTWEHSVDKILQVVNTINNNIR